MKTLHKIFYKDSKRMDPIPSDGVDLIVTSPPYPMIDMWDEMFCAQNSSIKDALKKNDGRKTFELMHKELEPVWDECFRVLKEGGIACINIGDATRKVNGDFCLYSNHSRILQYLLSLGFNAMPDILWRKQTNAPNKFMGSGMLPAGAYVTLEHEFILVLRKGSKREFKKAEDKRNRQESAIFWEERNIWFSDIWMDIKGASQSLSDKKSRSRSAAYPFEVAYRLINMFSVKDDVVLDPFLGTGTTTIAAIASGRNSLGFEIDPGLGDIFSSFKNNIVSFSNEYILSRITRHLDFLENYLKTKGPLKHTNKHYGFPVVAGQEREMLINNLEAVKSLEDNTLAVSYSISPQIIYDKECPLDMKHNDMLSNKAHLKRKRSSFDKEELGSLQLLFPE